MYLEHRVPAMAPGFAFSHDKKDREHDYNKKGNQPGPGAYQIKSSFIMMPTGNGMQTMGKPTELSASIEPKEPDPGPGNYDPNM